MGQADREGALAEAREYRHNPRRNKRLRPMVEQWDQAIMAAYRGGGWVPGADPLPVAEAGPLAPTTK
jgi:hypothetical protein